jgi:hypothetical protein
VKTYKQCSHFDTSFEKTLFQIDLLFGLEKAARFV